MRVKLRYVLPLAQMILAAVTIWWFYLWINLADRIYDSPGSPVGFNAVLLMNAPVSIARSLFYQLSPQWSDSMYVASVGILWYWVALNVDSWYERRRVVMFRRVPIRIATDLVLIMLGPYSIWQGRNIDLVYIAQFAWKWSVPVFASCLLWMLGPPLLFGRDLVHCWRQNIPHVSAARLS